SPGRLADATVSASAPTFAHYCPLPQPPVPPTSPHLCPLLRPRKPTDTPIRMPPLRRPFAPTGGAYVADHRLPRPGPAAGRDARHRARLGAARLDPLPPRRPPAGAVRPGRSRALPQGTWRPAGGRPCSLTAPPSRFRRHITNPDGDPGPPT